MGEFTIETSAQLETVLAWQEAVNKQDREHLVHLSDPSIEIVGPRGSGYGHRLLLDWLIRAGLTLDALRVFARGDAVVILQHGTWRSPDTGEVVGERQVASSFRVSDGQVVRVARFDTLDEALLDAGLGLEDEVSRA